MTESNGYHSVMTLKKIEKFNYHIMTSFKLLEILVLAAKNEDEKA